MITGAGLLLSAVLVALNPVAGLVVGEEIVVTASRCYGNECDDDDAGGTSNYYYLGSGGSHGYAISAPTPSRDMTYSSYSARQAGLTADFVSMNSHISSGSYRYVPPTYVQPQVVQHYDVAINRMKAFVVRRDDARNTVQHMDNPQTRLEIVEYASDAMRVAKGFYVDKQFEDGDIASNIADTLLDIATSTAPVVSWVRDLYEAVSGKDMLSGETLGTFSHTMAILGSVSFGFGSKAGKAIQILEKFTLVNSRPARKAAEEVKAAFYTARKLLYEKPLSELKDTIRFLKKYKFYGSNTDHMGASLTNAFMNGAKREITREPIHVVRYSKDGGKGYWVTTKELSDPHNQLALLHSDPVKVSHHTIKEGSEILRGKVAPQRKVRPDGSVEFDRPGGAEQILLDVKFLE